MYYRHLYRAISGNINFLFRVLRCLCTLFWWKLLYVFFFSDYVAYVDDIVFIEILILVYLIYFLFLHLSAFYSICKRNNAKTACTYVRLFYDFFSFLRLSFCMFSQMICHRKMVLILFLYLWWFVYFITSFYLQYLSWGSQLSGNWWNFQTVFFSRVIFLIQILIFTILCLFRKKNLVLFLTLSSTCQ